MKSVSRSDLYGCCFFCGQCEKLYNLLYILKVLSITFKHYFTLLCCLKYSIVNKLILVIIDNINVFIFGFICVLQSVHIFLKVKSRLVLRTDRVCSVWVIWTITFQELSPLYVYLVYVSATSLSYELCCLFDVPSEWNQLGLWCLKPLSTISAISWQPVL